MNLSARRASWVAIAVVVMAAGCAANDGMRFQVISMERPPEGLGLPPPADYTPCYSGEARAIDTDGDGHVDVVRVSVQGKDRCYGEDTNHDGKIDTWDIVDERGGLAKRAHDSNGDGKVDQAWTFDPTRKGCSSIAVDRDRDGQLDPGPLFDTCAPSAGTEGAPPPGPGKPR
jgi:hypothetical protein